MLATLTIKILIFRNLKSSENINQWAYRHRILIVINARKLTFDASTKYETYNIAIDSQYLPKV